MTLREGLKALKPLGIVYSKMLRTNPEFQLAHGFLIILLILAYVIF